MNEPDPHDPLDAMARHVSGDDFSLSSVLTAY
jgi:hypothetical protein